MKLRPSTPLARVPLLAALAGIALFASACGESLDEAGSASGATQAQDASLAGMLPASVKEKGTITVAAAIYAPAVMAASATAEPTGWDIQLTREAAALLGLKVEFKIIPFNGVIPGLQAGRYDAATGEIYVTPERTKTVTFVVNHVSRDEFLVRADSQYTGFASESDVCGLVIGASLGSAEADFANKIAAKCKATGGKATTVKTFNDQATVNLALDQGRIDVDLASGSQAAYAAAQSNGKFKVATIEFGDEIKTGLAIANNADTAQLAAAFEAATNKLIEDGRLKQILDQDNGGLGVITKSEIVPAPAG